MTEIEQFDIARRMYPNPCGKLGNEVEFKNFCKRHKNWRDVLPLLAPAIQAQIKYRKAMTYRKEFVPNWKMFGTWINKSGWTEEIPQADKEQRQPEPKPPTIYKDGVPLATKEQKSNIFADLKKKFMGGV